MRGERQLLEGLEVEGTHSNLTGSWLCLPSNQSRKPAAIKEINGKGT